MDRGLEDMRLATPLSKEGMGKEKRPATDPELLIAGRGGLPPAVPVLPPLLLLLLLARAMEGGTQGGAAVGQDARQARRGQQPALLQQSEHTAGGRGL
ncbi:hypothetical protein CgunFtcFv8_016059 [Champsocephalus gunnari]|uniref:Uncharacterized protein n=1 Tax=Champsocephalus gunnari TaxID=52237 RepID=A0AAN8CQ19_CHAGU|nr:hypothetical protein CgunFtcFv8_016059 [Champsocephalus gunnari]